jgi:hypothetical protein
VTDRRSSSSSLSNRMPASLYVSIA